MSTCKLSILWNKSASVHFCASSFTLHGCKISFSLSASCSEFRVSYVAGQWHSITSGMITLCVMFQNSGTISPSVWLHCVCCFRTMAQYHQRYDYTVCDVSGQWHSITISMITLRLLFQDNGTVSPAVWIYCVWCFRTMAQHHQQHLLLAVGSGVVGVFQVNTCHYLWVQYVEEHWYFSLLLLPLCGVAVWCLAETKLIVSLFSYIYIYMVLKCGTEQVGSHEGWLCSNSVVCSTVSSHVIKQLPVLLMYTMNGFQF